MERPDPSHPLTVPEKLVFGVDAQRHPITGYVLEQGYGALSENEQAELHCRIIDAEEGRAAGNELRRKVGLPVAEDIAAANALAERIRAAKEQAAYAALEEKPALEAQIAALESELAGKSTVHLNGNEQA
jgi:hypothetical protein